LSQGVGMIAEAGAATRIGQSASITGARKRRAGSRIGTMESAARKNEIAMSPNTTGSPAWSPSTAMIAP